MLVHTLKQEGTRLTPAERKKKATILTGLSVFSFSQDSSSATHPGHVLEVSKQLPWGRMCGPL